MFMAFYCKRVDLLLLYLSVDDAFVQTGWAFGKAFAFKPVGPESLVVEKEASLVDCSHGFSLANCFSVLNCACS